jgi:hypothetical protein
MRGAKNGQWWVDDAHRALANNSAAYTEKPDIGAFMKEWLSLYDSKSGERGIVNRVAAIKKVKSLGDRRKSNYDFGTNPCGEIILRPNEFCNLTEVVIREQDTLETLLAKIEFATIMGTFQSTLTDFRYLRSVWKKNVEEERLLGVSLTGIMDHPVLGYPTEEAKNWFITLREHAVKVNKEWADKLGIPVSASITTVKPSGCADPETKIKTSNGVVSLREIFEIMGYNIEDYEAGSWLNITKDIKVFDENNNIKPITKLFVNGISATYELTDESGKTYNFTAEHKVKVTGKGWTRVDALEEGDDVVTF